MATARPIPVLLPVTHATSSEKAIRPLPPCKGSSTSDAPDNILVPGGENNAGDVGDSRLDRVGETVVSLPVPSAVLRRDVGAEESGQEVRCKRESRYGLVQRRSRTLGRVPAGNANNP